MSSEVYDIAIIGAGPTGLYAAFYAGMRNLRTLVLEALSRPGGQISALYPEKYIFDVGGYPAVLARDLVQELWKQANQFGATFRFNGRVEGLEVLEPGRVRLTTPQGTYESRTVVISAGLGAFEPNKLSVSGATEFEGRGLSYVVGSKEAFLGRRLLIVGGGDTAVDWALDLRQWAREITLIHRREHFEAHEGSVLALRESKVHVLTCHELKAMGGDGWVEEATIQHNRTGAEHTLRVTNVLACIGFEADIGPIKEWGLELAGRGIRVNGRMETNLPGVFAAGDITVPADSTRMNLIATGFGQALVAVNCANRFIHPQARFFPGHSSQRKGMKHGPTPLGTGRGSMEPEERQP